MTQISNETEFRRSLSQLEYNKQRELAGMFVNNVVGLCSDDRVVHVVKVALDKNASDEEMASSLKTAKAATFDCHTRCGSEGDWKEQAGYFVARAAASALMPESQNRGGGPAWQAAMSSRMARTSEQIDSEDGSDNDEIEQQYRILSDYLRKP